MAALLGLPLGTVGLFVGFGLVIGVLFGFFGMGGSFLVTPALLVMDYPPTVAIGSGLAFVFGTAVIATLKHRDLGQVDYKLGAMLVAGTTVGIDVGKHLVLWLQAQGLSGPVINVTYVVLLGGVGLVISRDARRTGDEPPAEDVGDGAGGGDDGATDPDHADDGLTEVARRVQAIELPPMVSLRGDVRVSLWVVLLIALATGLLSGVLGVGGGFVRMPALFYLVGVPVPIAVGTGLFGIVFSGGIGSYLWALEGGVNLGVVVPLLAGSALGARIGSAATDVVDADEIKGYFGAMLLMGAVGIGAKQLGGALHLPFLRTVAMVIILGAAVLVVGAVLASSVRSLREGSASASTAD